MTAFAAFAGFAAAFAGFVVALAGSGAAFTGFAAALAGFVTAFTAFAAALAGLAAASGPADSAAVAFAFAPDRFTAARFVAFVCFDTPCSPTAELPSSGTLPAPLACALTGELDTRPA
ncbi:hypothetical protein GCM10019017_44520 [Streptomyces showdoensis]